MPDLDSNSVIGSAISYVISNTLPWAEQVRKRI